MYKYGPLLKEKNFLFYCVAQVFSQFGDRLVQIVLIGFVYKISPGSTIQLAKLLTFTVIPAFFISPIAGVCVDRWNKKSIMIISDLIRGALALFIAISVINSQNVQLLYFALFLIFASACFFLPAKFSVVPDLVTEDKLLAANSIVYISGVVAGVAGFALGGLMAEWMDLKWSAYINAFVYILSAICLFFVVFRTKHTLRRESVAKLGREITNILQKSFFHELKEGFKYLLFGRHVRFVVYIYFILMSAVGAVYVVLVLFVQETLRSMTKDVGLFGLIVCMGLLLGSYLYGKVGHRHSKHNAIFASLLTTGLFIALFAALLKLTGSFFVGAVLIFFVGLAISPVMISANTIIHESIDENMRGRIFSYLGIVMNIGLLVFMFIASGLAEIVGKMWVLIATGILFSGCGTVGFLLNKTSETNA